MNGLSWNATFQNPVTYVSQRHWDPFPFASFGEIVPWHLLMWLYGERPKSCVSGFLEPAGCPTLWCPWPLLLGHLAWGQSVSQGQSTALVVCPEAPNVQVLSSPRVLRCLPSSLWSLSSFGRAVPKVSFGVTEHGNCWLLVWLSLKFTCSVPALIFSLFSNGSEYQANV